MAAFGFLSTSLFVNIGRQVREVKDNAASALAGHVSSCLLRYKGLEDGQARIERLIERKDEATRWRDEDFKNIIKEVEKRFNDRVSGMERKLDAAVAELVRGVPRRPPRIPE